MTLGEIKERIKSIAKEALEIDDNFGDDTPFNIKNLSSDVSDVDEIEFTQFIIEVEDEFEFDITDEDIILLSKGTLNTLAAFVDEKLMLKANPPKPKKKATIVTDVDFEKIVLESDIPVLVFFYTTWATPCKTMAPIIEELAQEYDGKALVAKFNTDENKDTASKLQVMSVPMFFIFKGGQSIEKRIGATSKEELSSALGKYL